ncbi:MAG: hypothetical protein QNJ98_03125 [Planctomycetota bacterium]|nr:hypothetical protein [Planctomycetota bacterium]
MILKQTLIVLLGLFFILNGINHYYNQRVLEGYARKRKLFMPTLSIRVTGVVLILGGATFIFADTRLYGTLALCGFMVMATALMHRFWEEKDKQVRMLETQHFAKNLVILVELVYIQWA